ncbi:hypothetical protein [Henriciella litoralis]|uniref:hypothetical protein n=1 Tax=Henriciella litoralis TaxID=568102 RepID=UPI000A04F7EA|nr:hypothetical protein [Henriciella litoralis]
MAPTWKRTLALAVGGLAALSGLSLSAGAQQGPSERDKNLLAHMAIVMDEAPPAGTIFRDGVTPGSLRLQEAPEDTFLVYTQRLMTRVNFSLWHRHANGELFAAPIYGETLGNHPAAHTLAILRAGVKRPTARGCWGVEPVATPSGLPYLLLPETWLRDEPPSVPTASIPIPALDAAMTLGRMQAAVACDETFAGEDLTGTPYQRAMNEIGSVEGLIAALGKPQFASEAKWSWYTIFKRLDKEVRARQAVGKFEEANRYLETFFGRRNLSMPLLAEGMNPEYALFMLANVADDNFLKAYDQSAKSPNDLESVWTWLDDSYVTDDGPGQLARLLAVTRWVGATRALFSAGTRDDWQLGLNGVEDEGCQEVTLSLLGPVETLSFFLRPTGSQCVVVSWDGEGLDPLLPPGFAVLAESKDADAADLDGLILVADQSFEHEIDGAETDASLPVEKATRIRNGLVVEDARTGDVVKNWELLMNPDASFEDGKMTLVFTNARRDAIADTRPLELTVTFGEGVHKAEADLDVTTFAEKDTYCERPRQVVPPLPSGPMVLMETGRTVMGYEGTGFDKAPTFSGIFRVGGVQGLDTCSRAMTALGVGTLGEDMGLIFGGMPTGGLPEESPLKVCQARMASVQAGAMQAMKSGQLSGATSEFELNFEMTPEQRLTGPGTYPARFSLVYTQPDLEARGYYEPTYADGRGTVTVISQSNTHVRLRYDVELDDPGEPCEARITGKISGEVYTPFALASAEEAFAWAMHPRDVLGEKTWNGMPEAAKSEMLAEWQSERKSELRSPSSYTAPQMAESGLVAGCSFTEADIDAIIEKQLEGVPDELYQSFYDLYAEIKDPAYPPELICMMKDEVLGKN